MKKRYTYLLEILIGVAVILFINVLWFSSNMGFVGWAISPYWLVVIFVAARYGSFPGFVAGLAGGAALLISVSYNAAIEQHMEFAAIPVRQAQLSALFMLVGFLLGEERSRVNLTVRKWQEKFNLLRNEFESLAMEHVALKNVNTELQGRILGQTNTVNTIYETAKQLVTLKIDDLYPSVANLTRRMIDPEKCSLYIWEDEKYVLKSHAGWDHAEPKKVLDVSSDIFKKALAENAVTTVVDVFKSDGLKWKEGEDPPIVAPLFFGEQTDVPAGFIVIDEISFLKFSPETLKFLKSLSDWVSKSIDNAKIAASPRRKDLYDEEFKIFNFNYARRKLTDEFLNVQVSGRSTSILFLKMKHFYGLGPEDKKRALEAFISIVSKTVRASDTVARFSDEDTLLAILPGSNEQGAKIAEDRLKEQIKKMAAEIFPEQTKALSEISVQCKVMDAGTKDVDAILAG